jgi:hypothetical protein
MARRYPEIGSGSKSANQVAAVGGRPPTSWRILVAIGFLAFVLALTLMGAAFAWSDHLWLRVAITSLAMVGVFLADTRILLTQVDGFIDPSRANWVFRGTFTGTVVLLWLTSSQAVLQVFGATMALIPLIALMIVAGMTSACLLLFRRWWRLALLSLLLTAIFVANAFLPGGSQPPSDPAQVAPSPPTSLDAVPGLGTPQAQASRPNKKTRRRNKKLTSLRTMHTRLERLSRLISPRSLNGPAEFLAAFRRDAPIRDARKLRNSHDGLRLGSIHHWSGLAKRALAQLGQRSKGYRCGWSYRIKSGTMTWFALRCE